MTELKTPQRSNGGKGKYEVVNESEFNHRISGGSRFNGFIVYPNQTYGFALPLQGYDTIRTGFNTGFIIPKQNHIVFKPMQDDISDRIRKSMEVDPISRNPKDYAHQRNRVSTPSLGIVPNPIGIIPSIIEAIPNTMTINIIFRVSGDKEKFDINYNNLLKGRYSATDSIIGLSSIDGYVSDSKSVEKANETNQWVNKYGVFYVDDIDGDIKNAEFTNYLLGCLIYGIGYENIVFPTDGTISNKLKDAGVVKDALNEFYKINKGKNNNLISLNKEISGTTFSNNFLSIFTNGPLHPETFLGSANVKVSQINEKQLRVEVFNITSLTSGDFFKHFDINSPYPMSIVRDQLSEEYQNLNYGNVSQTYSFTIDIDFSRLGVAVGKAIKPLKEVFKINLPKLK